MFGKDGPFNCLPAYLKSNQMGLYMVLEKLVKLLEGWICEGTKKLMKSGNDGSGSQTTNHSLDDRNRKIVHFVGFALSSTITYYSKLEKEAIRLNNNEKRSGYNWVGTFYRKN